MISIEKKNNKKEKEKIKFLKKYARKFEGMEIIRGKWISKKKTKKNINCIKEKNEKKKIKN